MKTLTLGASGMLGSAVFRELQSSDSFTAYGTIRSKENLKYFDKSSHQNIFYNIYADDLNSIEKIFESIGPDVVINCIGIINKYESSSNPLIVIPVNSIFPHYLSQLCRKYGARLIQPSTDCIFSGSKGNYNEEDASDCKSLYGKSKYLGEIHDQDHVITLRTSLIGHELETKNELLEWFLSQDSSVNGYTDAIFSGLTTQEFAHVLTNYVLIRNNLFGLFHLSLNSISKFELLKMISKFYKKDIRIIKDDSVKINRSLNSNHFRDSFGYKPPEWETVIVKLYDQFNKEKIKR